MAVIFSETRARHHSQAAKRDTASFPNSNPSTAIPVDLALLPYEAVVASLEEFIEKGQLECLNEDKDIVGLNRLLDLCVFCVCVAAHLLCLFCNLIFQGSKDQP